MYRPSPIGLSVVKLNKVEKVGKSVRVYVTGSDLLNGTILISNPIFNILMQLQRLKVVMHAEPERNSHLE